MEKAVQPSLPSSFHVNDGLDHHPSASASRRLSGLVKLNKPLPVFNRRFFKPLSQEADHAFDYDG